MTTPTSTTPREVWFLTGSQRLYGPETLEPGRRAVPGDRRGARRPAGAARVRSCGSRSSPTRRRDPPRDARGQRARGCVGVIAWMHTFSPAKMWITGLDALRKPLLHLHTQAGAELPWSTIDMDFMNLNQAAHGDREFGFVQTRLGVARKTVAGHVERPRGRRADRQPGPAPRSASPSCGRCGWPASATTCATSRSPRATRSRRSCASASRSTPTASTTSSRSSTQVADAEIDELVAEYAETYAVVARAARGRRPPRVAALRRPHRAGPARLPRRRRFRAFTTNFEDLGGLRQLPGLAVQRLMADGYGFGGEGDWKTSVLLRTAKAMAGGLPGGTSLHGGLHVPPGAGARRRSSAPTCSRSARRSRRQPVARDPPARHRRPRGPRPPEVHRGPRARCRRRHDATSATGSA